MVIKDSFDQIKLIVMWASILVSVGKCQNDQITFSNNFSYEISKICLTAFDIHEEAHN
jgi:hypothetical protein